MTKYLDPLPDSVAAAMQEVLDFLLDDEKADFDAASPADRSRHIYLSLRRIETWLREHRPTQAVRRAR
jgi:hypothetical protein